MAENYYGKTGSNDDVKSNIDAGVIDEKRDQDGYIYEGSFIGNPTFSANEYALGCRLRKTDAATGALSVYTNVGTVANPNISLTPGTGTGITQLTGDVTAGPGIGSQASTIGAKKVKTAMIDDAAVTGKKVATNLIISYSGLGVDASGGAANATVTGVKTGDILLFAMNVTDGTDDTAKFAATANGTDTISQLNTDLSAKTLRFLFLSQQA